MKPLHKDDGQLQLVKSSCLFEHHPISHSNTAKVMHHLPVLRNVVLSFSLPDAPGPLVLKQAGSRVYAEQPVLKRMLHYNLN